ncbi:Fe-S cluster assembly ATPase SufC [Endothiovibrio diazotrophicus]
MLSIKGLHAEVEGKPILHGIDLEVGVGEVHAVMGPNGSGKSTLSYLLAGRDGYRATAGEVTFDGEDLLALDIEARAARGLFLAMQYPVELPGVGNAEFLREAVNGVRRARGEPALDGIEFLTRVRGAAQRLEMDPALLQRSVNAGFSGGEKKRNEILQMALLEPKLAILDETDSGLDIDALRTVAQGINTLRSTERGMLLITHYQRLLDYVEPDFVHVLAGGRIVRSGDRSLARELERRGYGWITGEEAA